MPGERSETRRFDRPLVGSLAPAIPLNGGRWISDKLSVTYITVFLRLLVQHVNPVLRAVGLTERERRIDGIGNKAPACRQVVIHTAEHTLQLLLTRGVVEQIDCGDEIKGPQLR